jgi:hypothetical protein
VTARPFDAQPFGLIAAGLAKAALSRKTRARLERGDSPRTGERVWRNSYTVGQIEDRIWKPINGGKLRAGKRWTGALLKAAKALELRTRAERRVNEPGARNGALGAVGLAVLEYLYDMVDYATGRLDPAIRTIADAIGHAYSAVHDALVRLRHHGFLTWARRSKPIENPEPGGQQVEQVSNAYGLLVPAGMKAWLARLIGNAPAAACEEDRARRRKQDLQQMLAGLSASDYQNQPFNDGALFGPTLKSIAAAIDAREATRANPPGPMKPGDHSDPEKEWER